MDRHGYHLRLDRVPICVCGQCGEAYFESREVEAIQDEIGALDRQARRLTAARPELRGRARDRPAP